MTFATSGSTTHQETYQFGQMAWQSLSTSRSAWLTIQPFPPEEIAMKLTSLSSPQNTAEGGFGLSRSARKPWIGDLIGLLMRIERVSTSISCAPAWKIDPGLKSGGPPRQEIPIPIACSCRELDLFWTKWVPEDASYPFLRSLRTLEGSVVCLDGWGRGGRYMSFVARMNSTMLSRAIPSYEMQKLLGRKFLLSQHILNISLQIRRLLCRFHREPLHRSGGRLHCEWRAIGNLEGKRFPHREIRPFWLN